MAKPLLSGASPSVGTLRQPYPGTSSPATIVRTNMRSAPGMLGFRSARAAAKQCVGPAWAGFFEQNYAPALAIARRREADVTLPLGLSNAETGHGTSSMNKRDNNPFGGTPHGFSTDGVHYSSIPSAWWNWDNQWGPRIQGVGEDVTLFEKRLLQDNRQGPAGAVDHRGMYNSLKEESGGDPRWPQNVRGSIAGVRNRLPIWLQNDC